MERDEVEEFTTGPLSVLTTSVKTNSQVSDPFSVAALLAPPPLPHPNRGTDRRLAGASRA